MNPLLELRDVACLRGGRLLFEGLDLRLGPGEAIWVRGPNGAGKSSLLRLCAGLLKPAAGKIAAAATALADEALALDRERTLRDALGFWARLDREEKKLDEALAAFDLDHLRDVPVRMLSTGQARRARLARVLASGAPLWLLDEPLNGLDAENIGRVAQAVERHRHRGGAVLAASHLPLDGESWRILELSR